MPEPVVIADYDPRWPARFAELRDRLAARGPLALRIEHVGSTAVPGLAAPPGSPAHHLYACPLGSPALARHLALRDLLRADPEAVGPGPAGEQVADADQLAVEPHPEGRLGVG